MAKEKIAVLRSRFQPFTKAHYNIVKYFFEKKKELGYPNRLCLLVIRDYEMVRIFHFWEQDETFLVHEEKTAPDKTGEEVVPSLGYELFRHLPLFNPWTGWETIMHINHSIHEFLKDDKLIGVRKEDFVNFIDHSLSITLSPIKFSELFEIVTSVEPYTPRYLAKYINNVKNRIMEVFKQKCKSECKEQEDAFSEALQGVKSDMTTNVLNLISKFTIDLFPQDMEIWWLVPMFDKEDIRDLGYMTEYSKMKKYHKSYKVIHMVPNPSYQTKFKLSEGKERDIGIYGIFILYAIKRLMEENILDFEWGNREFNAMQDMDKKIREYMCCDNCYNTYIKGIDDYVDVLDKGQKNQDRKWVDILELLSNTISSEDKFLKIVDETIAAPNEYDKNQFLGEGKRDYLGFKKYVHDRYDKSHRKTAMMDHYLKVDEILCWGDEDKNFQRAISTEETKLKKLADEDEWKKLREELNQLRENKS